MSNEASTVVKAAASLEPAAERFTGRKERSSLQTTPGRLASLVLAGIVFVVLTLWMLPPGNNEFGQLMAAPDDKEDVEDVEELEGEEIEELEDFDDSEELEDFDDPLSEDAEPEMAEEELQIAPADKTKAAAIHVDLSEFGLKKAARSDLMATISGAFFGREHKKADMLVKYGGTRGSEKAVGLALKWLANHQLPDGSWNFDHTQAPSCGGKCPDKGKLSKARNGATAMALLPFLGAGETHKTGKYKNTVKWGLHYLRSQIKYTHNGGSLREPNATMYSHGLATIALCEAYAMTQDKELYKPAREAIKYTCHAQDPVGGGWRYYPKQAGDTSASGWQIVALKSGHMAYLEVPPIALRKAFGFLDKVALDGGATYVYLPSRKKRGAGKSTTAIGLLCRMYLGWKKDNEALKRGVQTLSRWGPSQDDMYYNYHATQVMRHWEGPEWKKWNQVMRHRLIERQAKGGHEEGSWAMKHGRGISYGGRLYCTAMAAMTLEVYYRHMPIYRGSK